jgi:hypothetical protein
VRGVDLTHQYGAIYIPAETAKRLKTMSYAAHHFGTQSAMDLRMCPAVGGRFFVLEHRRKD